MRSAIRFFSVMILAMAMNSLYAQPGQGNQGQRVQRTPEESTKTQVEWMKKDIKLTE